MANEAGVPTTAAVTRQKIDTVEALLQKLKDEAGNANRQSDTFMLGVYKELTKVCSPIVTRAIARLDREEKAAINKAHKGLLKAEREAREKEKEAQNEKKPEDAKA